MAQREGTALSKISEGMKSWISILAVVFTVGGAYADLRARDNQLEAEIRYAKEQNLLLHEQVNGLLHRMDSRLEMVDKKLESIEIYLRSSKKNGSN
jgi:uncharacterized protein YlxW (UPF0749 family)